MARPPRTRWRCSFAASLSKSYAVYVEPLIFYFRRPTRLRLFGVESLSHLPVARLDPEVSEECEGAGSICHALARRYQQYFRKYHSAVATASGCRSTSGLLAVIDLETCSTSEAYQTRLKKVSGNFLRDAKKASRHGYATRLFAFANHTVDICEIRRSLKMRAFGPVFDAFLLNIDALGGPPVTFASQAPPACARHWELFFGIFLPAPGHSQGSLVVGERLVGYARIHRAGNVVRIADFMGHGDHMRHGVMMRLHVDLMHWLLNPGNPWAIGVRYITYGAIEQGGSGLAFWKKKALFEPHKVDFAQAGTLP